MYKNIFSLLLIAILFSTGCKPKVETAISIYELQLILDFIATDSLKGRYPGTAEDKVLAEYIASEMKNAGIELQSEQGAQYFDINTGVEFSVANSISFNNSSYTYDENAEFQPMGFSSNDTLSTEIVFAGNLSDFDKFGDDIEKQANGKWLMLMLEADSLSTPIKSRESYIEFRTKALKASDHKVAGIIYVSGSAEGLEFPELSDRSRHGVPIPALMITRDLASKLLQLKDDQKIEAFSQKVTPQKMIQSGIEFEAITQIDITTSPSFNSTALLTGSDENLSGQYIVIGAHHDHLGWGGRVTSSRTPDTIAIHYGADDNASGVAGVLELAEHISSLSPARSFLFMTFGGEEIGLIGSKFFAENPTIELENVQTMINLDMIGRLNDDRQIQIGGIGTSPNFMALIDTINLKYNFSLKYSEAGFGPSDHSSFYAKDIPVLFISTGAHTDYHTPADNVDKINFEGMQELLYFVSDIAMVLANDTAKIEFTEAGPKTPSNSRGRMGKVTFGLMPDMTYDGDEGMPVTFVTEGKPAASCGMKGGDIIKAIDGKSVGNVYDYMERLGHLKIGQSVIVKVERDEEELELLIQL